MRNRLFIVAAVLVLVTGVVGRITYERTVNTTTAAYAQEDSSDSDNGNDSDNDTTDDQYDSDAGSASPEPGDDGSTGDDDGDLIDSGASGPGPVLTLPDGSCIPEYPNKRNGYCYR